MTNAVPSASSSEPSLPSNGERNKNLLTSANAYGTRRVIFSEVLWDSNLHPTRFGGPKQSVRLLPPVPAAARQQTPPPSPPLPSPPQAEPPPSSPPQAESPPLREELSVRDDTPPVREQPLRADAPQQPQQQDQPLEQKSDGGQVEKSSRERQESSSGQPSTAAPAASAGEESVAKVVDAAAKSSDAKENVTVAEFLRAPALDIFALQDSTRRAAPPLTSTSATPSATHSASSSPSPQGQSSEGEGKSQSSQGTDRSKAGAELAGRSAPGVRGAALPEGVSLQVSSEVKPSSPLVSRLSGEAIVQSQSNPDSSPLISPPKEGRVGAEGKDSKDADSQKGAEQSRKTTPTGQQLLRTLATRITQEGLVPAPAAAAATAGGARATSSLSGSITLQADTAFTGSNSGFASTGGGSSGSFSTSGGLAEGGSLAQTSSPSSSNVLSASGAPKFASQSAFVRDQVFVNIQRAAEGGIEQMTVKLRPESLGRIEIRLEGDSQGRLQIFVLVERGETLDLLQRDARDLEQALKEAGVRTQDQGLQFGLKGQQSEQGSEQASTSGEGALSGQQQSEEQEGATSSLPSARIDTLRPNLEGHLDVQV